MRGATPRYADLRKPQSNIIDVVTMLRIVFHSYSGACPEIGKGGGRNLKPSVFRPKSSEEQKKVNTSAYVQFSGPKSSEEQKKVITSSQCPLCVHHHYTTKILCICLRGGAAVAVLPPEHVPDVVVDKYR